MSRTDRTHWEDRYSRRTHQRSEPPCEFLVAHADLLPPGRTVDLACGRGANASFLAERGHVVVAVDVAIAALRSLSGVPGVSPVQMDLDKPGFRPRSLDSIVCTSFLDRRLFPRFEEWLRPGGRLLLDTFLVDQAAVGHPRNPAFLLQRGELAEALQRFRILRFREGEVRKGNDVSFRSGILAVASG